MKDYSGRRPVNENMKDYSGGRRPVTKNRPRKQPVGIYVVILLCAVGTSFAIGVGTGWLIRKPAKTPNPQSAGGEKGAAEAAGQQGQRVNPEARAPGLDPPLTFYETLPKGGKAIIGSGLNPKRSEETAHSPAPSSMPLLVTTVPQAATAGTPVAAKAEERKEPHKAPTEQAKQQNLRLRPARRCARSSGRHRANRRRKWRT